MVGSGLMHLKRASEHNAQSTYGRGLTYMGIGFALIALGAIMGTGVGTIFGSGSGSTGEVFISGS